MTKIQTMKPIEDELAPFPFGAGLVEAIGEVEESLATLRALLGSGRPIAFAGIALGAISLAERCSSLGRILFYPESPYRVQLANTFACFRRLECEAARLRDSLCERAGIQNGQGSALSH